MTTVYVYPHTGLMVVHDSEALHVSDDRYYVRWRDETCSIGSALNRYRINDRQLLGEEVDWILRCDRDLSELLRMRRGRAV